MKIKSYLLILVFISLSACSLPSGVQSSPTAAAQTDTAVVGTNTPPATATFTAIGTFTPTITLTPTPTLTPSITPTPTFAFPKVTVNVANLACLFGPSKEYLWARDLHQGDTGVVWGRAPLGVWLFVKMDRLDIPCWVHPAYVNVVGDIKTVIVEQVRLPITNTLYSAPKNVVAKRDGDKVTVSWDAVAMTQDDDYGYFLDVWVCQDGNFVWMPVGRTVLTDQYQTSYTFTDQKGCSQASGGQLYTVEKHGYTSPVTIPWPPND